MLIIIVVDYGGRRMPLCQHILQLCFIAYTYYLHSEYASRVGVTVIIHKIIIFPIFI